jgi:hypothetical protein
MNDQTIRQLKRLKSIEPDLSFVSSSRRTILAFRKQEPVFTWPSFRLAGAFAGLVAMLITSIALFSGNSASMAIASPEVLSKEFSSLNINIELQEIDYRQNINQTIASAISEISNNKARHLNQDVLSSESDNLNLDTAGTDPQIDQLLNSVIQ